MNDSLREKLDIITLDVERGAISYRAGTERIMELISSTIEDIEIEHTKDIEEAYRAGQIKSLGDLLEPLWHGDKYTLDFPLLSGDPWQVKIAERLAELEDQES